MTFVVGGIKIGVEPHDVVFPRRAVLRSRVVYREHKNENLLILVTTRELRESSIIQTFIDHFSNPPRRRDRGLYKVRDRLGNRLSKHYEHVGENVIAKTVRHPVADVSGWIILSCDRYHRNARSAVPGSGVELSAAEMIAGEESARYRPECRS